MNDNIKKFHFPIFFLRVLSYTVFFWAVSREARGQQEALNLKTVQGTVLDMSTGTPIPGATVLVKGSRIGGVTNEQGFFKFNVPSLPVVLVFSYLGYTSQERRQKSAAPLLVKLDKSIKTINQVIVSAKRIVNTELTLLNERKNSGIIQDGISAENIEKTASITTTQALQRVVGITVTDDKYIAIRGLGDRNVLAEVNGARIASSDPDRSSVPLDLVPAALLDNISVYKTLTPDKPADATAGIIELKTKSVPEKPIIEFSAEGGSNSTVGLGGQFNGFLGNDPGYFGQNVKNRNLSPGFLMLQNQYPKGLSQIQDIFINSRNSLANQQEAFRIDGIMHSLDPVLTTRIQNAKPNQILNFALGNSYKIFGGHSLGVVVGTNYYNRTEDNYDGLVNQWSIYQGVITGNPQIEHKLTIPPFITPNSVYFGKYLGYHEHTGRQTLNYGWLAVVTYRFNKLNEVSVQYLGSRGSETRSTALIGQFQNTGFDVDIVYDNIFSLKQNYRKLSQYNVQGEHKFWNSKHAPSFSWNASASNSNQNEPDFRFTDIADKFTVKSNGPLSVPVGSHYYTLVSGVVHGIGPLGFVQVDPNGRYFRTLNEDNRNYKFDFSVPFAGLQNDDLIKFGGFYLKRSRQFIENKLNLPGSVFNLGAPDLINQAGGNPDALVASSNIGILDQGPSVSSGSPRVGGFLYQILKSPNNYTGLYHTQAFYGLADFHLARNLRVIGGVRFESTDIESRVDTSNVNVYRVQDPTLKNLSRPYTYDITKYLPFYSGTAIYRVNGNMNFRVAYSSTLARPELREITNIYEYDPFQFAVVVGNPDLKNQFTRSLDFRWETFTGKGEVLAISAFGKLIDNQLTKTFSYNTLGDFSQFPEYPVIKFVNDPEQGKVYGLEFELRRSLAFLGKPLRNFFFNTNLLIAQSVIKRNVDRTFASRIIDRTAPGTSPLFEQPPYSINALLDYDNPKTGTDVTLSFNMTGSRLILVQLNGAPDIYDRPAPVLDLVGSHHLNKHFLIKGFIKNILNPTYREVYSFAGQKGRYNGQQYIHRSFVRGSEFLLGITYDVF